MTICISALAEDGAELVLVSDRMITANIPISYEYETSDVKKIYQVADKVHVLTAGNALYAYEIIQNSIHRIKSSQGTLSVKEIAQFIAGEYQTYRRNFVIKRYLEPRGLDLNTYFNAQQKLHISVIQEVERNLQGYNISVELIVAGIDNATNIASVYSVTHPGVKQNHDAIGYVCVGSGAPHAMYFLIGGEYKKSMEINEVKKLITEAKKKSEVAPGVGKDTEIIVLSNGSTTLPEGEEKK